MKISAKFDGCHLDLAVSIPITLGNVSPILNDMPQQPVSILEGLGIIYPYKADEQGDTSAWPSSLPVKRMQFVDKDKKFVKLLFTFPLDLGKESLIRMGTNNSDRCVEPNNSKNAYLST